MSRERTDGIFIELLAGFPPDWNVEQDGELPPVKTEEEILVHLTPGFERRQWTPGQINQFMQFRIGYEERYYEAPGGRVFHRPCGGGAMIENSSGVYCHNCGSLPNLLPPSFMHR